MARLTPDPSFYASPARRRPRRPRRSRTSRSSTRARTATARRTRSRVLDLEEGSPTYGAARRPARHAEHRRRAAPLRLERVLVRAVPVGAAPARRAPLPAGARAALVPHPRHRRQGRPARAEDRQGRSRPRRSRARRATAARTRSTAGRTASTSPRSATPSGDGPGGIFLLDHDDFSVKGAVGGGPRAAGARLRLLVAPQPRHGDHQSEWGTPKMVEDGLVGELLLGNRYGHRLHVFDLESRKPRAGDRPRRRAADGARAAPRARSRQGATGSSASSRRPRTCRRSVWLWRARRGRHGVGREGDHDPGRAAPTPSSCRRSCSRSARSRR